MLIWVRVCGVCWAYAHMSKINQIDWWTEIQEQVDSGERRDKYKRGNYLFRWGNLVSISHHFQ
jgi:hypothetical protein